MTNRTLSRLGSALVGMTLSTAVSAATPEDNGKLIDTISFLTGSLDSAVVAGLVPFEPVSRPGEALEFSVNLGLKGVAPAFDPPAERQLYPNSPDSCYREFALPQIEGTYENWFGFWDIKPLETDWGDLGTPSVLHSNTSVRVRVSIGDDLIPDTDSDPTNGKQVRLPAGIHTIGWEAETQLGQLWDVAYPLLTMPWNGSSETRYGAATAKKAAGASASSAARLKRNLAKALSNIAVKAGEQSIEYGADQLFNDQIGTASNRGSERVWVWDVHTPVIETSQPNLTLQALNFGGLWYSRAYDDMVAPLNYYDPCGRQVTLTNDAPKFFKIDETVPVTWTVTDAGPYPVNVASSASVTQRITVEDTQPPLLVPPAGFARESSTSIDLTSGTFSLGPVLVADLADPHPVVTHDAPDVLEPDHRYVITYTATDASDNSTVAPAEDPERYSQVVTVKTPGTNTVPSAGTASASTITSEPVAIELTGLDVDLIDGRPDPLEFKIVDRGRAGHGRSRYARLPDRPPER
jgi:hypothetical protein